MLDFDKLDSNNDIVFEYTEEYKGRDVLKIFKNELREKKLLGLENIFNFGESENKYGVDLEKDGFQLPLETILSSYCQDLGLRVESIQIEDRTQKGLENIKIQFKNGKRYE